MTTQETNAKEPFLGILQVSTTFHRPLGDVGNLGTWKIPIRIKIVPDTPGEDVVVSSKKYSSTFIDSWKKAAFELIEEGAVAIITSCGFLITLQPILQAELPVPLGVSALVQAPFIKTLIPKGKQIGVITFDAESLGESHLLAAGVAKEDILDGTVSIVGVTPGGRFQRILRLGEPFDRQAIEDEVVEAAERLVAENGNLGAIILECTNIPPYKKAIFDKVGVPVWDILTLGNFLYTAVVPESYK